MTDKPKWQCPICSCQAYDKSNGVPVPAYEYKHVGMPPSKTTYNWATHFICRGCSVHFANPNQFNVASVTKMVSAERKKIADEYINRPPSPINLDDVNKAIAREINMELDAPIELEYHFQTPPANPNSIIMEKKSYEDR